MRAPQSQMPPITATTPTLEHLLPLNLHKGDKDLQELLKHVATETHCCLRKNILVSTVTGKADKKLKTVSLKQRGNGENNGG